MNINKEKDHWVFDVDLDEFELRVIRASFEKPVLVDLWAEWCSPCIVLAPVLKKFILEREGSILLAKVEVDEGENMKLAGQYRVRGFPTVLLLVNGEEAGRFSGSRPLSYIRDFVAEFVPHKHHSMAE